MKTKITVMKTLPFVLSMFLIGTLAYAAPQQRTNPIVLTYEGNEIVLMENPRNEESLFPQREMESLIRKGESPIIIEVNRDIAWIYLNDSNGKDYPETNIKSDYFEIIWGVFPIKMNKTLKNSLKRGNKAFFETLGIEYIIKNNDVISKIDYGKFDRFAF